MSINSNIFLIYLENISRNIKENRKKINLSQEELAEISGIDRTYVSQIERCLCNPSLKILYSLATALNINLIYLISDNSKNLSAND